MLDLFFGLLVMSLLYLAILGITGKKRVARLSCLIASAFGRVCAGLVFYAVQLSPAQPCRLACAALGVRVPRDSPVIVMTFQITVCPKFFA